MINIGVIPYLKKDYDEENDFICGMGTFAEGIQVSEGVDCCIKTLTQFKDWRSVDWFFFWEFSPWALKVLAKINRIGKIDRVMFWMAEVEAIIPWHKKSNIPFIKQFSPILFVLDTRMLDGKSTFYLPLPSPTPEKITKNIKNDIPYNKKKLMCAICGNKYSYTANELYSERKKVISFFEKNHVDDFDLYGTGWDVDSFSCYKGTVKSKYETYQNYKFALCLENASNIPGYITEKIHDCIFSNIIPVYLGASDIEKYIPKDCFIDYNQFKDLSDMYEYLVNISEDDYRKYIDAQKKFMKSGWYDQICYEGWIKRILTGIQKYEMSGEKHPSRVSWLKVFFVKVYMSKARGYIVGHLNRLKGIKHKIVQ